MKKRVIMALLSVFLVAALVGGVTYSYYNAVITNDVFTSGTLTVQLANNGAFSSSVTGTWVSPAAWQPGDSVTATLFFTNTGSVDANHLYFMFGNSKYTYTGANKVNLMDEIIVTDFHESFENTNTGQWSSTSNQKAALAAKLGKSDGVLRLSDLYNMMPNSYAFYTEDDVSGDGITLAAGDHKDYALTMALQFDPTASNDYQGATCSFDLSARADQNSPAANMVGL